MFGLVLTKISKKNSLLSLGRSINKAIIDHIVNLVKENLVKVDQLRCATDSKDVVVTIMDILINKFRIKSL